MNDCTCYDRDVHLSGSWPGNYFVQICGDSALRRPKRDENLMLKELLQLVSFLLTRLAQPLIQHQGRKCDALGRGQPRFEAIESRALLRDRNNQC